MKKMYLFLCFIFLGSYVGAQTITFTDTNFKNLLLSSSSTSSVAWDDNNTRIAIDVNNDGEIQQSEALLVYRLQVDNSGIQNVDGLEFFTNVRILNVANNPLNALDVTSLSILETLNFGGTNVSIPLFTNLPSLHTVYALGTTIANLDFTGVTNLELLSLADNGLTTLDISLLSNLKQLRVLNNPITAIDLSNQSQLEEILIVNTQLAAIDVLGQQNLISLGIYNNQLASVDVSNLSNLEILNVGGNNLSSLTLANNTSLQGIGAYGNQLSVIDLTQVPNLRGLDLGNNQFTSIDLTLLNSLINVGLSGNLLTTIDVSTNNLISFDVSNLTNLGLMDVNNNNLVSLNIQNTVLSQEVDNHFFEGNPDLVDICVDEGELLFIQQRALDYGYVNANVSVCSLGTLETTITGITVYPNPSKGKLLIETDATSTSTISAVELYNLQGQKVLCFSEIRNTIDISTLANGTYILKVSTNQGSFFEKIVKK